MNLAVAPAITAVDVHENIRREQRVIQRGVEVRELPATTAANRDLAEFLVPFRCGLSLHRLERLVVQLRREIQPRAVCVDRRDSNAYEHLPRMPRVETKIRFDVATTRLAQVRHELVVDSNAKRSHRLPKLYREVDDLIFGPPFRTAPARDRGGTRNAQSRIQHLIAVREIENDVCRVGRGKTVTMQSGACG